MEAFGYEFEYWPNEASFTRPMRFGQRKYLYAVRQGSMVTGTAFRLLCGAILEATGLPDEINEGSAQVLVQFFQRAPARCKRAAEREGWKEYA